MQAARYSLRFVTGASVTGGTYGAGDFGEATYGQRASDPLEYDVYAPIPLPAGYPAEPAWMYRRYDTQPPFRAQIMARELTALGLVGVSSARLILAPENSDGQWYTFPLEMEDRDKGIVRRDWEWGDLADKGVYYVGIILRYTSGRLYTVPYDSRLSFVVNAQDILP